MRSLLALFLSLTLFSCTFDLRSFAQTGTSISQAGFTIAGLSAGAVRNVPRSEEAPKKVLVIEQCERDQSRQEGRRNLDIRGKQGGEAVWRYRAAAALTLEGFGDHKIAVHRVDPKGTYSSQGRVGG
jgi:hypothetical protein